MFVSSCKQRLWILVLYFKVKLLSKYVHLPIHTGGFQDANRTSIVYTLNNKSLANQRKFATLYLPISWFCSILGVWYICIRQPASHADLLNLKFCCLWYIQSSMLPIKCS